MVGVFDGFIVGCPDGCDVGLTIGSVVGIPEG